MNFEKIKVILIGACNRGTTYTDGMKNRSDKFEVVAVAEPIESRRNDIKKKHKIADNIVWLSGNKLPTYTYGKPSLYMKCKRSEKSMAILKFHQYLKLRVKRIYILLVLTAGCHKQWIKNMRFMPKCLKLYLLAKNSMNLVWVKRLLKIHLLPIMYGCRFVFTKK